MISGNEIEDGLEKEDCGIFAVKSSRSLVRREKAGRTGYSWSVIMTATVEISQVPLHMAVKRKADLRVALHLPYCIRGPYSCSLEHSDAHPELCVLRQSW